MGRSKPVDEFLIRKICGLASEVYLRKTTKNEALLKLCKEDKMNKNTADNYIANYQYLVEGRVIKRTVRAIAMGTYLEHIYENCKTNDFSLAIRALELHIEYLEDKNKSQLYSMRKVADKYQKNSFATQDKSLVEDRLEKEVKKAAGDSAEERAKRLQNASKQPKVICVTTSVFDRNPDVVVEVLSRANGFCEKCKTKAPFIRARDNTPYLEVHHKTQLANGGDDTVENAIAVCPNCHRELHFGIAS